MAQRSQDGKHGRNDEISRGGTVAVTQSVREHGELFKMLQTGSDLVLGASLGVAALDAEPGTQTRVGV